jgi:hypothetical protein
MFNLSSDCEPMLVLGQEEKHDLRLWVPGLQCARVMARKDERIGFRVPAEIKVALVQIAKREGRSMAQVCELLLKGGIIEYEKEGAGYLHRLLIRSKDKGK